MGNQTSTDTPAFSPNTFSRLLNLQFPIHKGQTFQLSDGRLLGYEEYVHPKDQQRVDELLVILL